MARNKPDFSGYATKNDIRCTDGRIIRRNAFVDDDGQSRPLVWQHLRNDPENILGHCDLENRPDGVYAYGYFNDTPNAQLVKTALQHGDLNSLSIYANQLKQVGSEVLHGAIKEVSIVLAGANEGAKIDNIAIAHGDGSYTDTEDEAVITYGSQLDTADNSLSHADEEESDDSEDGETVRDVFNTLTDKQKTVVYAMLAAVAEGQGADKEVAQSDDEGEDFEMKKNVFDSATPTKEGQTLSHGEFMEIVEDAKKCGSLKQAFIEHKAEVADGTPGIDYGVANLDLLFPEYQAVRNTPDIIKRDDEWVSTVISGTNKTPFARIKNLWFDITADAARARGYIKGHLKKEEVVKLAKRQTGPTTIYKKQRLDRDDIIDITNFDIVAWLKTEMQSMLREEIARAILIGDGRPEALPDGKVNPDKIDEECIRPIYKENELYAYHIEADMSSDDANKRYKDLIDQIFLSMADYKGSGSPTFFTTRYHHIMLRKVHDGIDRRLYNSDSELASAMGVGGIVDVPVLENMANDEGKNLIGIIVNLKDYTVGTNRGGQTAFFDDFDIDYNQYSYLYETRLSGALTRVDSAIIVDEIKRPPLAYKLEPEGAEQNLLDGDKTAADVQKDVVITANNIDGKLLYTKNFTEWSAGMQEGHYLALKFTKTGTAADAKIAIQLTNSKVDKGWKDLDEDGQLVLFIHDEMIQRLKVRISSATAKDSKIVVYDLSGLQLLPEEK